MKDLPVHSLARRNDVAGLATALADAALLEAPGAFKKRPLHHACQSGAHDAALLLIERGADIEAADDSGHTPLSEALRWGHYALVAALLEAGCKPVGTLRADTLQRLRGILERVRSVEAGRSEPLKKGLLGLVAAEQWELVTELVEAGCVFPYSIGPDPRYLFLRNAPDALRVRMARVIDDLAVALELAAGGGSTAAVRVLLERGADPNVAGMIERPLEAAMARPNVEVYELLCATGPAPGSAHVRAAILCDNVVALEWLHRRGVAMDAPMRVVNADELPLAYAIRIGRVAVVRWFVEQGLAPVDAVKEAEATVARAAAREREKADAEAKQLKNKQRGEVRRARSAEVKLTEPPKPPKIGKALLSQLLRHGFELADEELVDPAMLAVREELRWLARVRVPAGVYQGQGKKGASAGAVRGLRFCRPWRLPVLVAAAGGSGAIDIVLGLAPGHYLTLASAGADPQVGFLPAPGNSVRLEGSKLTTLLKNLSPDPAFSPARVPAQCAEFSPFLAAQVVFSLAEGGVLDVSPDAVPLADVQALTRLRLERAESLDELDKRFASLEALQVRHSSLTDLQALQRLPALRRLMLYACTLADPSALAQLTALEELHLPYCLLTPEQLGFLAAMPRLRSVTLTGNVLSTGARAWLDALPPGLDPEGISDESLAFSDRLHALGVRSGAASRGNLRVFPLRPVQETRFGLVPWKEGLQDSDVKALIHKAIEFPQREAHEPAHISAWPMARRDDPVSLRIVPDEIYEQLTRLGVTFDLSRDVSMYPTATTRLLAQARWPNVAFASSTRSGIAMNDFQGGGLYLEGEFKPPRYCIGTYSSHHMFVLVSGGPEADPHVYSLDIEEPTQAWWGSHYPLSGFLRSLRPRSG